MYMYHLANILWYVVLSRAAFCEINDLCNSDLAEFFRESLDRIAWCTFPMERISSGTLSFNLPHNVRLTIFATPINRVICL